MEQSYFDSFQENVAKAVELAASDHDRLLLSLKKIIDQAEQRLAESSEGDTTLIACHAGCKSCCVVNVSVLFPEALAIVAYLPQLPPGQLNRISERLDELWRAVRGLTDDERISLRQPCAFLDETGKCQIYPVRPLLCRSVTSTSAENCRDALTASLFEENRTVLMNLFQQQLFEAVYLGVGDGLERAGLEGRSAKLTGMVRYYLKKPEARAEFLSGKKIDWHEMA